MDTVISYTSKLLQKRWKYKFFSFSKRGGSTFPKVHGLCFHLCCHSLEEPFSLLKKGVSNYFCPYNEYKSMLFVDAFLAQGMHLKSHQRCSAGIRTCLSADQSSSSTLTESSFLFDPCLIHRDTVMLE